VGKPRKLIGKTELGMKGICMKNVGKIVTVNRVRRNVWALDEEAELRRLGLGGENRRHREETDKSRIVSSGQVGQGKSIWSSAHTPIHSRNEMPVHWQQMSVKFTARLCAHSSLV